MRYRLSSLFIFTAIVALLLAFGPELVTYCVWDGVVVESVIVQSQAQKSVKSVSYAPAPTGAHAVVMFGTKEPLFPATRVGVSQFTVELPQSGKRWMGINYSVVGFRGALLHVDYDDGSQHRKVVDFPPSNGGRAMTVVVP